MPICESLAQYDDDCRLSFLGENWWIMAVRGPLILLTNENGQKVLDVSDTDWAAYQAAAVRWLEWDAHRRNRPGSVRSSRGHRRRRQPLCRNRPFGHPDSRRCGETRAR